MPKQNIYLDGRYFKVNAAKSSLKRTIIGVCQLCKPQKCIRGIISSFSNFILHLKRVHSDVYTDEYKQYSVAKLREDDIIKKRGRKVSCIFSQTRYEQNVTNYIILISMAPFSTVQMPSFRNIFDDLEIKQDSTSLKHLSYSCKTSE